jgi:hypothetical protein
MGRPLSVWPTDRDVSNVTYAIGVGIALAAAAIALFGWGAFCAYWAIVSIKLA